MTHLDVTQVIRKNKEHDALMALGTLAQAVLDGRVLLRTRIINNKSVQQVVVEAKS